MDTLIFKLIKYIIKKAIRHNFLSKLKKTLKVNDEQINKQTIFDVGKVISTYSCTTQTKTT